MNDTPSTPAEVTPPPFTPPDAVDALGLSSETAASVRELLRNADAEGYLRGRNESIEAATPSQFAPTPPTAATPVFPIYNHRSVWD